MTIDETPSKYFDPNVIVNQNALAQMVATAQEHAVALGIYTTKTYWTNIMGGIEGYSIYPLWYLFILYINFYRLFGMTLRSIVLLNRYPRYDGVDSMDFFEPFAGWANATIKQTGGDVGYCGISQVDSDYCNDEDLRMYY